MITLRSSRSLKLHSTSRNPSHSTGTSSPTQRKNQTKKKISSISSFLTLPGRSTLRDCSPSSILLSPDYEFVHSVWFLNPLPPQIRINSIRSQIRHFLPFSDMANLTPSTRFQNLSILNCPTPKFDSNTTSSQDEMLSPKICESFPLHCERLSRIVSSLPFCSIAAIYCKFHLE